MKKILLCSLLPCLLTNIEVNAQWCVPASATPYNANMPGITHVVINNIDRTSSDLEDYPNNSYVNTGLSTELVPGQTYSMSISFTSDPQIAPDMNIRVWIDYNKDYQLDDAGETVISANNLLPGTYVDSFTVPLNVTPGSTRMRVTAKMTPNGGHTLPTPCDMPADPLGYHGEIEDYEVILNGPTGISNPEHESYLNAYVINEKLQFSMTVKESSLVEIKLFNLQGKLVSEVLPSQTIIPGRYEYVLNASDVKLKHGVYLAVMISNNKKQVVRLVYP